MSGDELTLKVGRRGASLLLRTLIPPTMRAYGDERRYLETVCYKLKDFIDTPPPKHVELQVISVNGIPAREYYGSKEDSQSGAEEGRHEKEGHHT